MNRDNTNQLTPPRRSNLSIIQRLIVAYKLWHEFLPHFPKTSRYTLGEKIDSLFIKITELVFTASLLPRNQKLPYVKKAAAELEVLKFFLQISWEIKALENKKFILLSEKLDEIGKMLGGWLRQLIQENSAINSGEKGSEFRRPAKT